MVDARVWKQVKDEARQSLVRVLEYPPIRIATEGGRIDSRGSERVSEVYSPSILKLVRDLDSPPPYPRDHHVLVIGGAGQY